MTVSTMQLGVCAVYALLLWIIGLNPVKLCGFQAPDKQSVPKSTTSDIVKTLPVGFCAAAAHSSSVFALGGDPLFGQIVKAGEPVVSALVDRPRGTRQRNSSFATRARRRPSRRRRQHANAAKGIETGPGLFEVGRSSFGLETGGASMPTPQTWA